MVKIDHPLAQCCFALWRVGQGVSAAHRETGGGIVWVEQLIQHIVFTTGLIADARHVLGVDDVALALQVVGIEQRREKEFAKAIQRAGQRGGLDIRKSSWCPAEP
ncbi:hypothetical protein DK37_28350 [Halomonas sp. SUBG004]|nr:hypothetical protein DK37_28350 [Halomonas sp. SUBG004]